MATSAAAAADANMRDPQMTHEHGPELRIPEAARGRERGLADPRVAVPEKDREALGILRRRVPERHGREMTIRRRQPNRQGRRSAPDRILSARTSDSCVDAH